MEATEIDRKVLEALDRYVDLDWYEAVRDDQLVEALNLDITTIDQSLMRLWHHRYILLVHTSLGGTDTAYYTAFMEDAEHAALQTWPHTSPHRHSGLSRQITIP